MTTTNYSLPTISATDDIDFVNDINAMMSAIDTALYDISSKENPELEQLKTDVSGLKKTVSQLQNTIKSYVKITTYGDLDQHGALTIKEA